MRNQLIGFVLMCQYRMVDFCGLFQDATTYTITSTMFPQSVQRFHPRPHRPEFPMSHCGLFQSILTPPPQLKVTKCGKRSFVPIIGSYHPKNATKEGANTVYHQEWPWMAHIASGNDKCSGMLITNQHVLTAASCVYGKSASSLKVTLGAVGRLKAAGYDTHQRESTVDNYKYHEDYNPETKYNDIAIIKLTRCVSFKDYYIYPICLPFDIPRCKNDFNTKFGFIVGFNTNNDLLHMVPTRVIHNRECTYYGVTIQPNHICAGGYIYNHDNCWRDLGSGLIASYCGKWYALGVVSHYRSCLDTKESTVSARVASYLKWIKYYFL